MAAAAAEVTLSEVSKSYGAVPAVRDLSLEIHPGEIVSLLGPSGCGKTTTLRMIAGLERLDRGTIRIAGEQVSGLPPWRRNIGMVFQNYALFPHMTVFENIAFGLTMRGETRDEIGRKVGDAVAMVRLVGLEERRPSQLSGGQRQRVAFARAIVTKPLVLLLDEPLSALDKNLREQMQIEIRELQRSINVTTVFVTHDQQEALALSDRLVVMDAGEVVQVGTPKEIYEHPKTRFVSDFIGLSNRLPGRLLRYDGVWAEVELALGGLVRVPAPQAGRAGDSVDVLIRPEKLSLSRADVQAPGSGIEGTVIGSTYGGAITYHRVAIGGALVITVMATARDEPDPDGQLAPGTPVRLGWTPEHASVVLS